MNDENLRTPTTEEAREIGRKGGIASGKARRERKQMREVLSDILNEEVTATDGSKITRQEAILRKLTKKMVNGELKAIELGAKLTGEFVNKTDITTDGNKLDLKFEIVKSGESK